MTALPKHVASRTSTEISERNGHLLKYGTVELDRTLLEEGLLNELHRWVFPCVAGSGDNPLDGVLDGPTHLGLTEGVAFASEISVLALRPRSGT